MLTCRIPPYVTIFSFSFYLLISIHTHPLLYVVQLHSPFTAYLWPPTYGQANIFCHCAFFFSSFFFLFPGIFSAVADWMSAILPHVMWPCANLECRSEMCCTRLAENTGCKNHAKIRHDTTGDHLQWCTVGHFSVIQCNSNLVTK